MFELSELDGLISEALFQRLNEDLGDGVLRFTNYEQSANILVTKLTGYTDEDLAELPILLAEIRVPYAWVVEKLAVRLITFDNDQYLKSVEGNFKIALQQLSKISKAEPAKSDNSMGSIEIKRLWGTY